MASRRAETCEKTTAPHSGAEFADLCLTTWLRRPGVRKCLEHWTFSTLRPGHRSWLDYLSPFRLRAPLCRDDDHPAGAPHAVDTRGRGILQDIDPSDVSHRKAGERGAEEPAGHRHIVDHEQRFVVRGVPAAAHASDPQAIGLAGQAKYVETGNATFQQIDEPRHARIGFGRRNRGNRTGDAPPGRRAITDRDLVFRRYDKIPEVSDRSSPDPQRDSALSAHTRLHVVDDEHWLLLVVDVEARPFAAHLDPDFGPRICLEIDVRLVFGRGLLTKSGPCPIWIRDVLRRVIAALLIFGTPIRGP